MTRATCRNCGEPIGKDERGWFHLRAGDGKPCEAVPDRRKGCGKEPGQADLFEVTDES